MKRVIFAINCTLLVAVVTTAQQPIDPFSVVLCEHVDFVGTCSTFKVEPWMRHKLVPNLGDFNDMASSIRVGSKVSVKIFQHANYQGGDRIIKADLSDLGTIDYLSNATFRTRTSFNDKVSSLIVIPEGRPQAGGGLEIGSRINLDGQPEGGFFPLPESASENVAEYPVIGDYVNDEADCVGLEHGVTADLYEHSHFKGQNLRLPGMAKGGGKPDTGCYVRGQGFDLGDYGMSEKVSSLIVYAELKDPGFGPDTVLLCEHAHYVGACRTFTLNRGMRYSLTPTLGSMNDKTSSVIVGVNVTAHVFEHARFGGFSTTYDSSVNVLTGSANDIISSLIVAQRGQILEGALLSGSGFSVQTRAFFPLPEQQPDGEARYTSFDGRLNDEAEWLQICGPHVSVTLFQHASFKEPKLDFPGLGAKPNPCAKYRLDAYQFDDVASSLIVRTAAPGPKLVEPHISLPPPPRGGQDSGTGTTHKAPPPVTLEPNSNRPGLDYRDFDLAEAKPELCRDACAHDPKCKAFTYIKPGIQGSSARCWLKDRVPPAEHAPCCVSGVKK